MEILASFVLKILRLLEVEYCSQESVFVFSTIHFWNFLTLCRSVAVGRGARGCQREGTDLIAHCHSSRRGGRPFLLKTLPSNIARGFFFSCPEILPFIVKNYKKYVKW